MKFADLSAATRQKIGKVEYDRILEKHEGPYDWNWVFRTAERADDLEFFTILQGEALPTIIVQSYYRSIPNIMPMLKF
jgi:hypothetical protein